MEENFSCLYLLLRSMPAGLCPKKIGDWLLISLQFYLTGVFPALINPFMTGSGCWDWFGDSYPTDEVNPTGPDSYPGTKRPAQRVLRDDEPARRYPYEVSSWDVVIGFRVVRSAQ